MDSDFVTVYAATIITHGNYAYVKKNGKPYLYLEGVEVNAYENDSPQRKMLDKLGDLIGIEFSADWLKYIGTTVHKDECTPNKKCEVEKFFSVIHYWLDVTYIMDFEHTLGNYFIKIPLQEMKDNTSGSILYTDSLAAKRVIELKLKK